MREEGQQSRTRKGRHDAQGFTNEDPKETTLLALLNATFATAFATGMPFCNNAGIRHCATIMARMPLSTHNLLMDVCVLDHVVRVPSPVRSGVGGDVEPRLNEGQRGLLQAELGASGERVVNPVHAECLNQGTRQSYGRA